MPLSLPLVVFLFFALSICLSVGLVLFTKNVLYAAFSLLLTFASIGGLYALAQADVLAVAQLLVYVGGILILIIFGVMFTAKRQGEQLLTDHQFVGLASVGGLSLLAVLWVGIGLMPSGAASLPVAQTRVEQVGMALLTEHAFAFELMGLFLLLALIGTALIAGHKPKWS